MNKLKTFLKKQYSTDQKEYFYYAIALTICLVISMLIASRHQLGGLELSVFRWFNDMSNSLKTPMLLITEGLGAAYPIILCILIPLVLKRYRLAIRFFITIAIAGALMEITKFIVREPRPFVLLGGHLNVRATELGLTSFPSGHVAVAGAMALTLMLILPKRWKFVSLVWIFLVVCSRLYLGVHTPNDVIGGLTIGVLSFCIVKLIPKNLAKKLHLDKEGKLLSVGF